MESKLTPLQEALLRIQAELKAPKNRRNSFGNYNYRDAEGILEAAKPLLQRENLLLTSSDEVIQRDNRFYVRVTYTLEMGDFTKTVTAEAREEETKKGMDGSQITGASSSYARKYALNGLFLIDDTKDSDTTNDGDEKPKAEKKTKTTSKDEPSGDKPEAKKVEEKKLPAIELNSKPFSGAVEWLAASDLMVIEAIEAIKKKYSFTPEVEAELVKAATAKKASK